MILCMGTVHGDPHAGNVYVRKGVRTPPRLPITQYLALASPPVPCHGLNSSAASVSSHHYPSLVVVHRRTASRSWSCWTTDCTTR